MTSKWTPGGRGFSDFSVLFGLRNVLAPRGPKRGPREPKRAPRVNFGRILGGSGCSFGKILEGLWESFGKILVGSSDLEERFFEGLWWSLRVILGGCWRGLGVQ